MIQKLCQLMGEPTESIGDFCFLLFTHHSFTNAKYYPSPYLLRAHQPTSPNNVFDALANLQLPPEQTEALI